jgi:hypothetical protein
MSQLICMRKARAVLTELITYTQPPLECPIVLIESPWPGSNWSLAVGRMSLTAHTRYLDRFLELEVSDPMVDWNDEPRVDGGQRCIILWMNDIAPVEPTLQPIA